MPNATLRMITAQQKRSGCFPTVAEAEAFCGIRSYTSTMRDRGAVILTALTAVFAGAHLALGPTTRDE